MAKTVELIPVSNKARTHEFSRFAGQDLFKEDRLFWGTWEPISIPNAPDDTYLTISSAFDLRLDLIAHRYYGSPELWWVLAEANLLFFPAEELQIDTEIRIPSLSTLVTLGLIR